MDGPHQVCLAFATGVSGSCGAIQLLDRDGATAMKHRAINFLMTMTLIVLACWAAWSLYQKYIQDPWTRDCQVRANVIGIAPRVAGPITRVVVKDNQEVA